MKKKNYVKGKSIKDIYSISYEEFISMKEDKLRQYATRLMSASNKRIKRMKEKGILTREKFSVKGKNLNELRSEFTKMKSFLTSEKSSLRGLKSSQKRTLKTLKENYGIVVKQKDFNSLFETFENLKDVDPSINNKMFKYNVLSGISHIKGDFSVEEKTRQMLDKLDNVYQSNIIDESSISSFFESEENN